MEQEKEEILKFLQSHNVLTAAITMEDVPWASMVYYLSRDFNVYFVSIPKTRLSAYLEKNPRIAITIIGNEEDWQNTQGLQIEGKAKLVSSRLEQVKVASLYLKKFPALGKMLMGSGGLSKLRQLKFYKVIPERMWLNDNSKGFGHKVELDFRSS